MSSDNTASIRELLTRHKDKRADDAETVAALADADARHGGKIRELLEAHACKVQFWDSEDYGLVAVAKPADPVKVYAEFIDHRNNIRVENSGTFENIALACVVHPDPEAVVKIADDYGGDVYSWARTAMDFCGEFLQEGDAKKEPEQVKALRETHKRLAWWDVPGVGIIVGSKPKGRQHYHDYLDGLISAKSGEASAFAVSKRCALACIVSPDIAVVEQAIKEFPALAVKIAEACIEFCHSGKRLGKA